MPTKSHSGHGLLFGREGRFLRRTTERYTLEDASAVEAECPDVLYVLPKVEDFNTFVSNRNGNQAKARLEGITADYSRGMGWEVHTRQILFRQPISKNAKQVCVLGANTASELFGETSPIGQEVKVRYHWRESQIRLRVIGVMATKRNEPQRHVFFRRCDFCTVDNLSTTGERLSLR